MRRSRPADSRDYPNRNAGNDRGRNMSDDTADSLISQGLELMLYGMGTVILFLGLLVLAITLMSWLLRRFFP